MNLTEHQQKQILIISVLIGIFGIFGYIIFKKDSKGNSNSKTYKQSNYKSTNYICDPPKTNLNIRVTNTAPPKCGNQNRL